MDKLIINQKLESLRRCLLRIEDKCPATAYTLSTDPDLQDIIVLNLTRSVQLCVDIASHLISEANENAPTTMGNTFQILEKLGILDRETTSNLRKAVGFRNVAVHNYEEINWQIVHSICQKQLRDFQEFAKLIVKHCGL